MESTLKRSFSINAQREMDLLHFYIIDFQHYFVNRNYGLFNFLIFRLNAILATNEGYYNDHNNEK